MHGTIAIRQLGRFVLFVCLVGVLVASLVAWPCVADTRGSLVGPASRPADPGLPIGAAPPAPQVHPAANGAGWQSYPLYGGEMTSLVMDPSNAQILYVGTRDAGVFKTTDGGNTWSPANVGLTCFPIRTLAIDPQHPSTLYAGTDYAGLWKSTDGGGHWNPSDQGLDTGLIVFQIVINPQQPNILYAGLGGGTGLVIGSIYKSVNGGATWQQADAGLPRYSGNYANAVFSMAIDPQHPDTLYAGTHFDGVYRSTNAGTSWTALNSGFPVHPSIPDKLCSANALTVDPHHNNRLGAIINGDYYVLSGAGWLKVSQGSYTVNGTLFRDQLCYHPTNPLTLYSAGDRFTVSLDGGQNWTRRLGWNKSSHVPAIAFHPTAPNTVYAATDILSEFDGGMFKTGDLGETWTEISQGITAVAVQSIAADPVHANRLYVGDGFGHLYRSEDGGQTWEQQFLSSSAVTEIAIDPTDPNRVVLAAGSLYLSTDYAETLPKVNEVPNPICVAIAPGTPSSIYVGTGFGHGILKNSGGTTWQPKNTGLPMFGEMLNPILSLAVDPSDPQTIWAGTQYSGGILVSHDGGDHWQSKGLTESNFVGAIAVHPQDSGQVLVGAGFSDGTIYKSRNGGATWQASISDIGFVEDIVYDPQDPRWVYAATEGSGVWCSFNGGDSWLPFNTGIFYPLTYSLAFIGGSPPTLLTGSYGSGLYGRPLGMEIHQAYIPVIRR